MASMSGRSMGRARSACAAVMLVATASSPVAARADGVAAACKPVPVDRIAVQLYSLNPAFYPDQTFSPPRARSIIPGSQPPRTAPRTARPAADPARVDAVLARVRAIGFRNVEGAGTLGATPQAFRATLDAHGLTMVGNHGALDPAGWDQALADASVMIHGPFIGSGGFGPQGLATLDAVHATARNLNALGEKASSKGLRLYVHNHTGEFDARYPYDINRNGRPVPTTAWEIVAAETDPRFVNFEVDVHWARLAFDRDEAAMLAFIRKHADRIVLLHIKDTSGDRVADLGSGETNWPLVYAAAPKAAYYIWEYDAPADPLRSAKVAFDYLTCAGRPATGR